jgi:hypothetical protein
MFSLRTMLMGFVGVLLLTGCSSVSIKHDYDSSTDFSALQTFSWMSERPLLVGSATRVSPLLEGRLLKAASATLTAKGMRFVANAEQADVVISFAIGARDKIRVDSYPANYRGRGAWGWGAPYYQEVDVRNYTEGTLSIDIFNVKKRQPIWHGWAVKTISENDRGNETVVKEIVAKILEEFPPQA